MPTTLRFDQLQCTSQRAKFDIVTQVSNEIIQGIEYNCPVILLQGD